MFSAAVLTIVLSVFAGMAFAGAGDHDDHAAAHTEEAAKGPHGGRLLTNDHFAVEVSIYETGVEPELRLYFYQDQQPIPAADVKTKLQASVTLNRLGEAAEIAHTAKYIFENDFFTGRVVEVDGGISM